MIPAAFEYLTARNLEDALRLIDRHGDEAKLLAGGHSLLPLMKLRLSAPRFVIDLSRVKSLRGIREDAGSLVIGAMTTHYELESSPLVKANCPLLAETAAAIGDVQVRNRGTIGGSLAHADPAADYPAAVLALGADIVAASSSRSRTIPATDFFVDLLTTQLRPGEILTEVRVPALTRRTGCAYRKFPQPASKFAMVGAAACVTLDATGKIGAAAVGMTGLASHAYRATAVEKILLGKKPSPKLLAEAAAKAAEGIDPLSDIHASGPYRRATAAIFLRRALEAAIAAAEERKA